MKPLSALLPMPIAPAYRRCATTTFERVTLTIDQAIERYGERAIWPPCILDEPRVWWCVVGVTTGDDGRAFCDTALTPVYFAARTPWRVVVDQETGRSELRVPCPECGAMLAHARDHDARHRGRRSYEGAA